VNTAIRRVHAAEGEHDEALAVGSESVVLHHSGRFVVAVGLFGAGVSHLPVLREHLIEAPYMGWLFGLFVVVCVSLTVPVCFHDSRFVYWVAVVICAAALLLYTATRLTAFLCWPPTSATGWSPGALSLSRLSCLP
jgi:hypothetical protein